MFKLGPDGHELVYASYLGGRGDDQGLAIAVNDAGEAIVAGDTESADFPTTEGAFGRKSAGGPRRLRAEASPDGSRLAFATLLGGSSEDTLAGLSLAADGEITVAGTTRSRDFPVTPGSVAGAPRGGRDVFVTRLDPEAQHLRFSARLGGADDDEARALAVDDEGCTYVTGRTDSHDFPTTLGALDRERCGVDAFVLKLSGGGRSLVYSTLLGGSQQDEGLGIAVDGQRRAVVVGWTQSLDFPFQSTPPDARRRVRRAPQRVGQRPGPRHGARWRRRGRGPGVALESDGSAWVVGRTRSRDLAVTGDALPAGARGLGRRFPRARRAGGRPRPLRDLPRRRGRGRAVRRVLRSRRRERGAVRFRRRHPCRAPDGARGQVPRAVGCVRPALRSARGRAGDVDRGRAVGDYRVLSATSRRDDRVEREGGCRGAASFLELSPPRVVEPVQAAHVLGVEVRVDLGGRDRGVSEHLLHGPQVGAALAAGARRRSAATSAARPRARAPRAGRRP